MQRVIDTIRDAVQSGRSEHLTAADLAHAAGYSTHYFSRLFSVLIGEPPVSLIRRLRLEKAAQELLQTSDGILRIAVRNGYGAHETFTRAFRHHFGVTPSEYRSRPQPIEPLFPSPTLHYGDEGRLAWRIIPGDGPISYAMVQHQPTQYLAVVPCPGEYEYVPDHMWRLLDWAARRGLETSDQTPILVHSDHPFDEVTPGEAGKIGIPVAEEFPGDPEHGVELHVLPGGEFAVAVYKGPYERIDEGYRIVHGEMLEALGREVGEGFPHEVYINSPWEVDRSELLTTINLPLKPKD